MKVSAMAARPRRWLREILLVLVLAVQAGWLAAWSAALGGWVDANAYGPVLGFLPLVGLLVLATLVSRVATTRLRVSRVARLGVALLGLSLAILVGVDVLWTVARAAGWQETWSMFRQTGLGLRDGSAVALALLAWWRGIAAGRNRLSLDEVESGFRGAITALVGVFLINVLATPPATTNDAMVVAACVVLFAGLIAMPLARIVDLSERSRHRDTASLGVRGHWLAILLGTVLVLLLVTYVLARVFTFERIDDLTRPLAGPADALLWDIIYVIAVPLGFLVEGIIYIVRLFLHPRAASEPPQLPNTDWLATLRAQAQTGSGPPALLVTALKGAVIAVLVAIVVWLLVRAVFRFAEWRSDDDVDETRDFVFSWAELREGILHMLRSLLRRRQRRLVQAIGQRQVLAMDDRRPWGPRELYRELLRMGEQHGRARARDETPYEYQRALRGITPFDTGQREVQLLTGVYIQARYGEQPPETAVVAGAREALDRLHAMDESDLHDNGGAEARDHLDVRQPPGITS